METKSNYFVLKYGNRQWIAAKGSHLHVDFLNTDQSHVDMDCIYDSLEGNVTKKLKCKVLVPEFLGKKIIIEKYLRRHSSQKRVGFRPKSTLIIVGEV